MGIIKEIMECNTSINNNRLMRDHYNDTTLTYDIHKYQDEFFKYMQNVYPLLNENQRITLKSGIELKIKKVEKVANYERRDDWRLCNCIMEFTDEKNNCLLSVTTDPYVDLIKESDSSYGVKVTGIDCIKVTRSTSDETSFVRGVDAFKYVMNHFDEVMGELLEKVRRSYLYVSNYSYYDNLDEIQNILDLARMARDYMDNLSNYKPFESKKVARPNFEEMSLDELIHEYKRKSNSDDVEKNIDVLSNVIMSLVPGLKQKEDEFTDFFEKVSDNVDYIVNATFLHLQKELTINNNGFSYYFKSYSDSSQMLIEISKGDKKIGTLYYWGKNNRFLYLHASKYGCHGVDLGGFSKENIPDFMTALQNMDTNWNQIVSFALDVFLKELEKDLAKFKKDSENMFNEKEVAYADFMKRQESFADYF